MCGIAGLIDFNSSKKVNQAILKKMSDVIIHRGPDSDGIWISESKECGLSFRRLSIIDLSENGNQPMHSLDGRYHIVFNGEIYNHKELRTELEKKGYRYHSNTDTETILYGYIEWGIDLLDKMLGMWAFAIWDDIEKQLFAARDRVGIKPFYYYYNDNIFVFGSEIKSILQNDFINRQIDYSELTNLLHFLMTSSFGTLFENIHKLSSGHYLILNNKNLTISQYWSPLSKFNGYIELNENQAKNRIIELLRIAIKDRMMSDVPFGVFLSGGIDSSLNVALMSELMDRPVDTFTVGFKDLVKYNELEYANLIARKFNTNHHEILIESKESLEILDDIIWHTDEPNGDPVCIPLYFLSKLTKDSGTTVIQVGEGSDEQFFGYDWIIRDLKIYKIGKKIKYFPTFLKKILYLSLSPLLNKNGYYIVSEYLRRLKDNEELYKTGSLRFSPEHLKYLYNDKFYSLIEKPNKFIEILYNEINQYYPRADEMQKMTYLELRHRLAETLLMRVDKITMAHSLEARVPFLDTRIIEFVMSLKENIKLPNKKIPKYLLKKAAEGIIPNEIIYRKKQGFAAPIKEWLKKDWYNEVYNSLINSFFVKEKIFNIDYIKKIYYFHMQGKFNFHNEIFILYILNLWYKKYIE